MLIKIVLLFVISMTSVHCSCENDRNVVFKDPLYLTYENGFFFIQALSNGESVVIYKHPEESRVFGQYTFKDEKCLYETVYYYVLNGKYEFTNPQITDENTFNVTNQITFTSNGVNHEIKYFSSAKGAKATHTLGPQAERSILPNPVIKKAPAPGPVKEIRPNFVNIGKQNLKVSYLKNGENYIQFISRRNGFTSIEGQYTFRTSDRKYHSITYEVPVDDFDYHGLAIREYEMSTEENYFKTGTIRLGVNGTDMDVLWFVNSNGFHVSDLQKPSNKTVTPSVPVSTPVPSIAISTPDVTLRPPTADVDNNRPVRSGIDPRFNRS